MKFNVSLDEEAVTEWMPLYIGYRHLKNLIRSSVRERTKKRSVAGDVQMLRVQSSGSLSNRSTTDLEDEDADQPEVALYRQLEGGLFEGEKTFLLAVNQEVKKVNDFYCKQEEELQRSVALLIAKLRDPVAVNALGGRLTAADLSLSEEYMPNELAIKTQISYLSTTDHPHASLGGSSLSSIKKRISLKLHRPTQPAQHHGVGDASGSDIEGNVSREDDVDKKEANVFMFEIKLMMQECYGNVELLKNFQHLNILACSKILKKFDKKLERKVREQYMEAISYKPFVAHDHISVFMSFIEDLYCKCFTDGDRYRAVSKLRIRDLKERSFHKAAYVFGLQGGLAILMLSWIGWTLKEQTWNDEKQQLGLIYAGLGTPNFLGWLSFIDCLVFHQNRINYPTIFAFDRRKQQHPLEYGVFVGSFSMAFLTYAYVSISGAMDSAVKPMLQPWGIILFLFFVFIVPVKHIGRSNSAARRWLLVTMWENLLSPFYTVRFRHFFIGDQFMSLGGFFVALALMLYYSCNGTTDVHVHNSAPYTTWYIGFLTAIPGLVRLSQCVRRYYDMPDESRSFFPHLVNGCKYLSGLIVIVLGTVLASMDSNEGYDAVYGILIFDAIAYQLYAGSWDIIMDFGFSGVAPMVLSHQGHRRFSPLFYSCVAPLTLALRAASLVPLFLKHSEWHITHTMVMVFWYLECMRRYCWNLMRIDNEHASNCEAMQAIDTRKSKWTEKWASEMFREDAIITQDMFRTQRFEEFHAAEEDEREMADLQRSLGSKRGGGDSPGRVGSDSPGRVGMSLVMPSTPPTPPTPPTPHPKV